jgi:hypothetical protein
VDDLDLDISWSRTRQQPDEPKLAAIFSERRVLIWIHGEGMVVL